MRLQDAKAALAKARAERQKSIARYRQLIEAEADLPDGESLPEEEASELEALAASIEDAKKAIASLEAKVSRIESVLALEAEAATDDDPEEDEPSSTRGIGQRRRSSDDPDSHRIFPRPEKKWNRSLMVPQALRFMIRGGSLTSAHSVAVADPAFGERHPVTRALQVSAAAGGGFIVPPEYVSELIEVQRPMTVVRSAGPRVIPMGRGTMQMPRQNQAATATYGTELGAIPVSEPSVGQLIAAYKKLTALVPITNDLRRYSDPSIDMLVRDDLARVIALREDLAFIRGDGTGASPRGFASFALAGQKITSTAAYTLATAANELGGALNKLETANVAIQNPCWIMAPRSKNYLMNVQNTNGFYVFKDEMTAGKLLGYPFKTTTQIPTNLVVGGDSDCSEIYLVEMSEAMVFDAMQMEISVSTEGTYVDASGATVSTFQSDQTLIRAISEHDFLMRHDNAVVMITGVRWAPAIT